MQNNSVFPFLEREGESLSLHSNLTYSLRRPDKSFKKTFVISCRLRSAEMLDVARQVCVNCDLLPYACAFCHTSLCCSESRGGEFVIVYRELKTLARDLGFPVKTLYGLSNSLEKHYHAVLLPKRDGTLRKLSVPDLILKRVQRKIADVILVQYPVSHHACGYVCGGCVQKNARPHIGKEKLLKLDVDGFFDHIRYSQVKDLVFYKEKFSEPVRTLLSILCYFRDSLPQGAPTSPAISNILMCGFDECVGAFCAEKGVTYTRYCDDMTFSGSFAEGEIVAFVRQELKKLGLFLKNRKTVSVPRAKRRLVTGLVVNEKLNLPKEYRKKIRQEMYYIKKFGVDEHLKKIGQKDKQKYLSSLQGRVAYVLQTRPKDPEFVGYKTFLKEVP